ncbi:helix-turn-helix domain-containing protein [Streptomyces canus]|uniref:helix-turn-helix domain-containing protein n=1 Tax=Streptomyces canus TaxID=58343 RepID=UPI002783F56C|nr:helix-turn-helix transcriptional regulator [Streptomyces canus]MDQ0762070.1 transcriptional regulator with XRE-family HTH domain [Streptomyces canus]
MNTPRMRRRKGAPFHHSPEAVTRARENAGLTQKALAEECGFSFQLLCDIEAGRRNATPERLRAMARVIGCPVSDLQPSSGVTRLDDEPPVAMERQAS